MKDNKLIAEFMGFQKTTIGWYDNEEVMNFNSDSNTFDELKFHSSWDWLMPVVAKINRDEKYLNNEHREYLLDVVPFGHIEDVYDAVIYFIRHEYKLEQIWNTK